MKNFSKKLDSTQRSLIGIFLIIVGIYLLTHYSTEQNIAVLYIVFGPILIIRGLAFLSI